MRLLNERGYECIGMVDTAVSPRRPSGMTVVREIATPPRLEALAGLDRVDYRESFTFAATSVRTAEDWARETLEHCPWTARAQMIAVWTMLGIPLAPPWSRRQVLGWRILHDSPSHIVLQSRAAVGVTAHLVLHTTGPQVTQAMLVRFDRPLGRRIWASLAPKHRRFIHGLLTRAASSPPAG